MSEVIGAVGGTDGEVEGGIAEAGGLALHMREAQRTL